MPALVVCGKRWLVGSDDFTLPALLAILVRLPCLGFTVGVIIYLFFGPSECLGENLLPEPVPPFLYGSLFAFCLILCMGILNEAVIFSVSVRGNIEDPKCKRKGILVWLFVRSFLIVVEMATSLLCTVAVFGPAPYAAGALVCPEYHDGPLLFARIVVVCMLITEVVYILGFAVFVDPCGWFCSPSILPSLEDVDSYVFKTPAELKQVENEYAMKSRLGHLHSNHVSYRDTLRKVRGAMCCFNANRNRSRQTAMQEMALALHTLFNNEDRVPSDLVAGLVLVGRKQKNEKQACEQHHGSNCPCLHVGLRKITFDHMPKSHLPDHFSVNNIPPPTPFDPTDPREQLLLDNLIHYMRYSMGIYGWTLHVFDNLLCGLCQIMAATCFRCKFRRWHPLAQMDSEFDHPRVVNDDCCMSGLATMKIKSDLEDQHIIYASYENEVFQAPFSVCIDDKTEAVVLTVRGTLSIQDAMTDLSISMVDVEPQYRNKNVVGKQCMHKGMYITAKHIYDILVTKKLLERAFSKHENYRLIITGHSLGAGVASMLSMMLEPYYPDLFCYAFSPPGCIFSFPLSLYSQNFIRVVVLGNDMIPRITFRSLFYLKRQTQFLMKTCQYSKFQILFRPRFFDRLPFRLRNCLFGDKKDPIFDPEPLNKELKDRLHADDEDRGANSLDGLVSDIISTKRAANIWKRKSRVMEGNLHAFVAGVEKENLVASFPPRNVLHIPIKQSKMPWIFRYCFPDKLSLNRVNGEDICVIIVDRGMIQDHLPNNVLAALIHCKKKMVGRQYRAEEIRDLREQEKDRVRQLIAQRIPLDVPSVKETSLSNVSPNSGAAPPLEDDSLQFRPDSNNSNDVTVVTIEPTNDLPIPPQNTTILSSAQKYKIQQEPS